MNLLLDTHTFLWLILDDPHFPVSARERYQQADRVYLSSVSAWEIAAKYRQDKLPLPSAPGSYIPLQRGMHGIHPLTFEEEDAFQLQKLPSIHKDPFDRMLICQAITRGLTILTIDSTIHRYPVSAYW